MTAVAKKARWILIYSSKIIQLHVYLMTLRVAFLHHAQIYDVKYTETCAFKASSDVRPVSWKKIADIILTLINLKLLLKTNQNVFNKKSYYKNI